MVDKLLHTSSFIKRSMSAEEKRIFSAIKRDILKEISVPKNSDYLMLDIIGCEYIKYVRALVANLPRIAIASAKAMREYLAELNLTPHSRTETNTSNTLSNIFKILDQEGDHARNSEEVHWAARLP